MNNPDHATRAIVAPVGVSVPEHRNPDRGSTNSSTPVGVVFGGGVFPELRGGYNLAASLGVIHLKPRSGLLAE
ncbi:hypothetical protein FACS1894139_18000 [Planctomycetales bacterium]|nr:hypothetical protein FACS1894107_15120 [Planctomycetales bacterium]GHT00603.1 hypothetical protein FACS1894108_13040 [Planctomycetales bacterium]GHT08376.1 hypothetical protein FACS1894139_18000 [Planctomycetales bacterium]